MHCKVPKFYGHWTEGSKLIIKMQHCESDLAKLLNQRLRLKTGFSELELLEISADLLSTLQELRTLNLVHMDIKPGRYRFK